MPSLWNELLRAARQEVQDTVAALPNDLRPYAEHVPVIYEPHPNAGLLADGWDADLLGMFDGDPFDASLLDRAPRPTRIFLFLENLWEFAGEDPEIYLDEVHITFLHELGHYLGLDEDALEERGLL